MLIFSWKDKYQHIFIQYFIILILCGGMQMGNLKNKNSKGAKKMAILTADCNRAFVVSPEQSKKFLEHKCNNNTNKEMLSKITSQIKDNHGKA